MANEIKHSDGSLREETGAIGERVKGAAKDAAGAVLGNEQLEREGERENAEGRRRQAENDAIAGPSRSRTAESGWSNKNLVTGLYDNPEAAGKAYQDLTTRHGYKSDDISVVMSDDTRKRHFGNVKPGQEFTEGSKAAEGAGIGGGIGLGVGAAVGAIGCRRDSDCHSRAGSRRRGPDRGGYSRCGRRGRDRDAGRSARRCWHSRGSRGRVPSAASRRAASSWVRVRRTRRTPVSWRMTSRVTVPATSCYAEQPRGELPPVVG